MPLGRLNLPLAGGPELHLVAVPLGHGRGTISEGVLFGGLYNVDEVLVAVAYRMGQLLKLGELGCL
jgi:hypothetical protein